MSETAKREWVQIKDWHGNETGWIPRDVLEGMGIDCSPLDQRDIRGKQGGIFFTVAQSKAIHAHVEWEPAGGREMTHD